MENLRRSAGLYTQEAAAAAPNVGSAATSSTLDDYDAIVDKFFRTSHKQIQEIIKKTEVDFKALKADMKKWEREKNRLDNLITKMKENAKPAEEVKARSKELGEVEKKLEAKWFLEYREHICDPEKYRTGKHQSW